MIKHNFDVTDNHSISGETWKKFTKFANEKFDIKKVLGEGKTLDFEGSFKINLDQPTNNQNKLPELKLIITNPETKEKIITYFPHRNLEKLLTDEEDAYKWTKEIGITFTNYSYEDLIELLDVIKYNENTPTAVYERNFLPTKKDWDNLSEFSKNLLKQVYTLDELILKHKQIYNYILANYKLNSLDKILNIFYVIDSAETLILIFEKYINDSFFQIDAVLKTHLIETLEIKRTKYAEILVLWEQIALEYEAELIEDKAIQEIYNESFWLRNINQLIVIVEKLNNKDESNFVITEYYSKIQEIFVLLKKQYILIYQNKKYLDRKNVLNDILQIWQNANDMYKKNIDIYKKFASEFTDVPEDEFYTFEFYDHKI